MICRRADKGSLAPDPWLTKGKLLVVLVLVVSSMGLVALLAHFRSQSSLGRREAPPLVRAEATAYRVQAAMPGDGHSPTSAPLGQSPIALSGSASLTESGATDEHREVGRERAAKVASSVVPIAATAPASELPRGRTPTMAEVERAVARVPIRLYQAPWCPSCRAAKAWLAARQYNVVEYDIERDPRAKQEMKQLNPRGGIPTITVGDRVFVGFDESAIADALAAEASRRLGVTVRVKPAQ